MTKIQKFTVVEDAPSFLDERLASAVAKKLGEQRNRVSLVDHIMIDGCDWPHPVFSVPTFREREAIALGLIVQTADGDVCCHPDVLDFRS